MQVPKILTKDITPFGPVIKITSVGVLLSFVLICLSESNDAKLKHGKNDVQVYVTQCDGRTLFEGEVIWTYWHSRELPSLAKKTIFSWKVWNPTMSIVILGNENISCFLNQTFSDVTSAALRSDLIRLSVLSRFGGIWLDSTVLLTESFQSRECVFSGIFTSSWENRAPRDVMESWYLRSERNGYIVTLWLYTLQKAVSLSNHTTKGISKTFVYKNEHLFPYFRFIARRFGSTPIWWSEYLAVYASFTYLYHNDRRFRDEVLSSDSWPAERVGYKFNWQFGWNMKKFNKKLVSRRDFEPVSKMVKISISNMNKGGVNLNNFEQGSIMSHGLRFVPNEFDIQRNELNVVLVASSQIDFASSESLKGLRVLYYAGRAMDKIPFASFPYDVVRMCGKAGVSVINRILLCYFEYIIQDYDSLPAHVAFAHYDTFREQDVPLILRLRDDALRNVCTSPNRSYQLDSFVLNKHIILSRQKITSRPKSFYLNLRRRIMSISDPEVLQESWISVFSC